MSAAAKQHVPDQSAHRSGRVRLQDDHCPEQRQSGFGAADGVLRERRRAGSRVPAGRVPGQGGGERAALRRAAHPAHAPLGAATPLAATVQQHQRAAGRHQQQPPVAVQSAAAGAAQGLQGGHPGVQSQPQQQEQFQKGTCENILFYVRLVYQF